ncbi:DUF4099 domain-containing protein [Mucilaginibacter sp. SMC90]|uniref:DUF4099 domain-containing protein n=1 Tax=Mucilaginibacter sp. SMC90 TaxID=2929803 RepID=UPI001FB38F1B|nr:DUF4099 domain-containing protein [Mucilaginibacter sp. SMC90]UOE52594.1 DUF4099 domain-containing protein [Mucilaginibacter sp. SMC90]
MLPLQDLETIGLATGGQLLLNVDDLKALLSGRRTGLMQLQNLEAENIRIKSIDAKISLKPDETGKLNLMIHPIYKKPATPSFLDDNEAHKLEKGEVGNYLKTTTDDKGNKKEILVEYDAETREFIVSDTEKILAPDMVNLQFLTAAQKENYRKGKEVTIADKTTFGYSATDPQGVKANKLALVASILIDGGLTYVVYKGLNMLFNQQRNEVDAAKLSPGYYNAVKDAENESPRVPNQMSRSYTRSGSR